MTTKKVLMSVFLLFIYGKISSQILEGYESSTTHIEAKKGNIKKDGMGYFFGLKNAKDESSYSVIILNKEIINGSESIQLSFTKEKINETDKTEIYIHTIPNNKDFVFSSPNADNKLALIHMGKIFAAMEKKGISTSEVYLFPNYIEMLQIPISEVDLTQLKESWEKQLKN